MILKIKQEDLIFFEVMTHPISASQILFHDFDSLGVFDKNKFGFIRLYQYPMLSYDSLFLEDKKLSKEKNWEVKNNLAESYALGGRLTGKSIIAITIDVLVCTFNQVYKWAVISSYDKLHLLEIFEKLINCFENHKIMKFLNCHPLRSPTYKLNFDSGLLLESVNQNITGKNPGGQYFGKHYDRQYMEESSYLTKDVSGKMLMAQSEKGCINRFCIREGTKILMFDFSTKNIEDIQQNDLIIAWDEKQNSLIETEVLNLFDSGIRDVIKIDDSRNELWLTPEHKIRCLSEGDKVYKWREAYGCMRYKYFMKSINYLHNIDYYLRGVLIGLIESDGSHYILKGKEEILHQFIIHQSDEVDFIEWLLQKLNIMYTKIEQKKHGWNKKTPYRFNINRNSNYIMLQAYKELEILKDSMYGFLIGFIIGDGYLGNDGSMMITQSNKTNRNKVEKIESILNILKLKYCKNYRESNKSVQFSINKYELPFYEMPCKKGLRYRKTILNIRRPIFNKEQIKCKGYLENQQVYDIETKCHSFIANGFIVHNSGMTTFTKTSPMGEIFFNLENKKKIVNLPSYVNPTWNDKKETDAIKEFGGKDSIGYQVQIDGKVIEGAESVFDIQRIRQTYILDKQGMGIPIKSFEINKDSYFRYKEIIIIEKPNNAESLGIYFDVGEGGAPSEYIIVSKTNKIYKYIYRITTFQLSPDEEKDFIEYLIEILQPNIVGLDHSSGVGKSLYSHLIKKYPENIIPIDFNSNIEIDFERDDKGKEIRDKEGHPVMKKANVVDWSIQCLKDIFYNKKIQCYEDIKLDTQINNIIVVRSKQGKILYSCKGANHLFQAFQVFAITHFLKEMEEIKPITRKKPGLGYFGEI